MKERVAFAGLGAMGFGMASHLVTQHYQVTGFDVYGPPLEKFAALGAATSTSPVEAARGSDFFICMVANSQQAESALFDEGTGAVKGYSKFSVSCTDVNMCRLAARCHHNTVFDSAVNFLESYPGEVAGAK